MTLVQTANPTAGTGNLTATLTNTRPGSLLLVFIGMTTNGDTVGVPTDNASNTYTLAYNSQVAAYDGLYYTRNSNAATSITVNFTGSNATHSIIVREYSGMIGTSSVLDRTHAVNGTSTAIDSGATTATRNAIELVVSSSVIVATSASITAGSGFGNLYSDNFGGTAAVHSVEDKQVSATGTQDGTMTSTVSGNFEAGVGTFVIASGPIQNLIKPMGGSGLSMGIPSN